jgi:hypothetical protein
MPIRRLPLLGIVAAFVLGACSSSGATTTSTTPLAPAPTTEATTTTSTAPSTAAATTVAGTPAAASEATVALVSQGLVAQTGGKLPAADATCIAAGLLAKYDLAQLAAMQSGAVPAEAVAATTVIIEGCVGADRAAEVNALLASFG